ncbi:hypothetical protein SAMN02745218_01160 [Desulfofundulus australicus DSM 11792]|uniref:Uncharacterized protein n=1 Tax=Desulfofundulus australicus DSM 11792 TaxID=1121425 RepID=A0A1M4XT15_9FIRM|nr:hypothetical protein SAMN02745218_01160 [Desulfofundulus australicus DSM 11792]
MGVVAVKRHDRAHIVFHRRRYLARRLKLARQIFGMFLHDFAEWTEKYAGRLSKWNLVCSCWLCRDPKYREGRAKEKRRWWREVEAEVL